jgi:hypothetical protein
MDVTEHDARAGARLVELVAGIPHDAWDSPTRSLSRVGR